MRTKDHVFLTTILMFQLLVIVYGDLHPTFILPLERILTGVFLYYLISSAVKNKKNGKAYWLEVVIATALVVGLGLKLSGVW